MARPSAGLVISNFTVTKANTTAEPIMFVVARNNGTAPASTGSFLVIVYGKNNSIQSCYDGSGGFFPLYSNESTWVFAPLTCGDIGDEVGLSVQADFLGSTGSVTEVFNARTTIGPSQVVQPSTVIVKQLGIKTWVVPEVFPAQTSYTWYLTITNEAQTPIDSVRATLSSGNTTLSEDSGCVMVSQKDIYGVTPTTPLTTTAYCSDDNSIKLVAGPFSLGQELDVAVSVTYVNGTASTASTTAVVEPPYALVQ